MKLVYFGAACTWGHVAVWVTVRSGIRGSALCRIERSAEADVFAASPENLEGQLRLVKEPRLKNDLVLKVVASLLRRQCDAEHGLQPEVAKFLASEIYDEFMDS